MTKIMSYTQSLALCRLLVLYVVVHDVNSVGPDAKVVGCVGESVTLPSGKDPSWKLSEIQWSIFPNATLLAKYNDGKIKYFSFWQFKDRVRLDPISGNLTIWNLSLNDQMTHTVDLFTFEDTSQTNNVYLSVHDHMDRPDVEVAHEGSCNVSMKCSSKSTRVVTYSWNVKPNGCVFTPKDRMGPDLNVTCGVGGFKASCTVSDGFCHASSTEHTLCSGSKAIGGWSRWGFPIFTGIVEAFLIPWLLCF